MANVYITGITGFLGSNIAKVLVEKGHRVIATYRQGKSKQRCADFEDKVTWIALQDNWEDVVMQCQPQIIIHAAWIGVNHAERNDWNVQYENIAHLYKILEIARRASVQQFIGLGSQAEYGTFEGVVDESHPLNPTEAYGCVKVICSEMLKQYAQYHHIKWYWLRLFSFFGKGESENWLIPTLIKKMRDETCMDLTAGEQKYAYLYAEDLGLAINSVASANGKSGVYNISGKNLLTLRSLVEQIRNLVNPSFQLNFGAVPYRVNQVMHMQGDTSAFIAEFGAFDVSDFNGALTGTINNLKKQFGQ